MDWNWQVIFQYLPDLLGGVALTVQLVGISGVLGLFFGLILALLRLSNNKLVQVLPFLYIFFFRGTPLLVQMFLIYYGLSQFDFVKDSALWEPVLKQPFWCAIIAFTLNTSAYTAEIIRGAIQSIPPGELEAADAIGMSRWQKLTRITLPRAFGIMLPAYSNEVIFMLKGSSLAMTIALMDITGIAKTISARTYTIFELYFAAGVIYLVLSWVVLIAFRLIEKRMNRHSSYVPPDVGTQTVP
ncbi:ABC transporter permease [Psychrobacter sp. FDAARGOS_221]|uniref:ABC transporter permease n=1 Tax=Psychrobacter sp. FDAARGOS_221 TaxID=1975705 RepID=UPI000BB57D25|nr:ABC transporter permease [Psychrobacter sp. FDAARGOS_221]PNK61089.1 ABC transporter permease [Psychrobacter sp. FDAARGOS_221]